MTTMDAVELSQCVYWEERARRFGARNRGLAAVCSFGMPSFYNSAIHACQSLALSPWLRVAPGQRVLDVGCGVGRWTVRLAARGATVTGLDPSPTMVRLARERVAAAGVADRCSFVVERIGALDLDVRFDLVLAVTVLQHIAGQEGVRSALAAIRRHLAPGGRAVLLEAAPGVDGRKAEHAHLSLRSTGWYERLARRSGLELRAMTGVDLYPLKKLYLPSFGRLPRPLATAGLALATVALLPAELLVGRRLVRASWHKVMVFEARPGGHRGSSATAERGGAGVPDTTAPRGAEATDR